MHPLLNLNKKKYVRRRKPRKLIAKNKPKKKLSRNLPLLSRMKLALRTPMLEILLTRASTLWKAETMTNHKIK